MLLFLTRRMQNNKLIGQMLPRKLFGLIAHGIYPWHSQFFFSIKICDVVLYMTVCTLYVCRHAERTLDDFIAAK